MASEHTTTTVDIMRHGEPVGGRKYRGQTDDPLSDKGWREMREAVGAHRPWDVIVSSTLRRCIEFAQELAARHQLPLETDPRLKEIGFGAWEGRTPEELKQDDPEQIARFLQDPVRHAPRGAEPLASFRGRVVAAWNDLLARHRGRHVLVVGHAGIVRALVGHTLDVPLERIYRVQVPTAGITRIRIEHHGEHALAHLLFHAGRL